MILFAQILSLIYRELPFLIVVFVIKADPSRHAFATDGRNKLDKLLHICF